MLNTGISAVLGLGFWLAAARYYSEDSVGQSSAAIAAMKLLAGITAVTLTGALARFIPVAGRTTGRLILRTYAGSSLVVALAALVFLVTPGPWEDSYRFLHDPLNAAFFVVAVVGWSVLTLQDGVLTGLRSALWVPVGNTVFSAVKLALLVAFAVAIPTMGVFVSWVAAIATSVLPLGWLVFRRLVPRHEAETAEHAHPPSLKEIGRFLAGDYTGSLFSLAVVYLIPVIVAAQVSPADNAYFYITTTIGGTVNLLAINMGASLTVEGSHDPARLAANTRAALRRMARIMLPVCAGLFLGAPYILGVFGAGYADAATPLLRWFAVGAVLRVVMETYFAVLRAQSRTSGLAYLQGLLCVSVLGLTLLLLPRMGLTGAGVAEISSLAVIVLIAAPRLYRIVRTAPSAGELREAATDGDLADPATPPVAKPRRGPAWAQKLDTDTLALGVHVDFDHQERRPDVRPGPGTPPAGTPAVERPDRPPWALRSLPKQSVEQSEGQSEGPEQPQHVVGLPVEEREPPSTPADASLEEAEDRVSRSLDEAEASLAAAEASLVEAEAELAGDSGKESPAEPEDAKPVVEPEDAKPVAEPEDAEPVAEPEDAEPVAEPEDAESGSEPREAEPEDVEPQGTEPDDAEPDSEPRDAEPEDARPDSEPEDAEPVPESDDDRPSGGPDEAAPVPEADGSVPTTDSAGSVDSEGSVDLAGSAGSEESAAPARAAEQEAARAREPGAEAAAHAQALPVREPEAPSRRDSEAAPAREPEAAPAREPERFPVPVPGPVAVRWPVAPRARETRTLSLRTPSPPPARPSLAERLRPTPSGLVLCCLLLAALGLYWVPALALGEADLDRMGGLGLVSILPPTTLAGAGLLVVVFACLLWSRREHRVLLLITLLATVVSLHALPAVIETEPRFATAWQHLGFIDYIDRTGSAVPDLDARWSWPGFFAAAAFLLKACGVTDFTELIRWWPLAIQLLYLAPMFLLMRSMRASWRAKWTGVWIFVLSGWVGQDYFSPQGFTYLLYLVFVAVLLVWFRAPRVLWTRRRPGEAEVEPAGRRQRTVLLMVLIGLFAVTVPAHQLTPFVMLGVLAVLVLIGRSELRGLPVLFAVMVAFWIGFMAEPYWSGHFDELFGGVGGVGSNVSTSVSGRIEGGSSTHKLVLYARVLLAGGVMAFACWGWLRRREFKYRERSLLVLTFVPFLGFGMQSYGGEMALRVFMFALPGAALLAGLALFPRTGATAEERDKDQVSLAPLAALMAGLVLMGGFLVARWGNEPFERIRPGEVAAMNYVYAHDKPTVRLLWLSNDTVNNVTPAMPWGARDMEKVEYRPTLAPTDPVLVSGLVKSLKDAGPNSYLMINRSQVTYLMLDAGYPVSWEDRLVSNLDQRRELKKVLVNEDVTMYALRSQPTGSKAPKADPGPIGPQVTWTPWSVVGGLATLALIVLLTAREVVRVAVRPSVRQLRWLQSTFWFSLPLLAVLVASLVQRFLTIK
nr:polysaccharide biosynthesis C-terminal domain-containing protein [Streptomyces cavernae]